MTLSAEARKVSYNYRPCHERHVLSLDACIRTPCLIILGSLTASITVPQLFVYAINMSIIDT